ncbi:MAG TPA: TadE family type IV pilus minor pilin [Solirubrobacteraceae bacterium]|jgi:Flp pilus assembly protein TadG|nr:TadE family type IV pilus minor pilin [Solirubrobacteraceae bacterium]
MRTHPRHRPHAHAAAARRGRAERGSATAETAVALPALLLVVAVCVWALGLVGATLRCAEAARAGARAAARGETAAEVTDAATRAARHDADVSTTAADGYVTVRVSWSARPPVPLLARLLPATTVSAEATARAEPEGDEW